MNKHGRTKTRYFQKNYAPAKFLADQRKSKTLNGKIEKTLKKTAKQVSKSTKQAARVVSKKLSNSKNSLARRISPQKRSDFYRSRPTASRTSAARKSMSTRAHTKRAPFTWRERALLSMIGVSAAMIMLTLSLTAIYDPVKRSERELEKLAHDYYIEYLYPRALGSHLNEPETVLSDYAERGLPNVKLRQLLYYDEGKNAASLEVFSNSYYQCDTNKTYVRFYPVAPYGPTDFKIYHEAACEKVGAR